MMYVKSTPAGSPAEDFDDLGDPYQKQGQRLHDRPNLDQVNSDWDAMSHKFDRLGYGAWDERHEHERAMRDAVIGPVSQEEMFTHGAPMPMTMENMVRYSGGEEREAVTEQAQYTDGLLEEYLHRYPEMANDEALAAAVENTMRELREHYREDPAEYARSNRREFLERVYYRHLSGAQRSSYDDTSRTAGISAGGPARGNQQAPEKADMIEELHAMQKARGIY